MEDKGDHIEVKIELADVANKCFLQIKETTESISRIYQAIELLDGDLFHKPIPVDNFPVRINDNKPTPSQEELKAQVIHWALKKGFEDFVIAFTKSFKETYRFLSIRKLATESQRSLTKERIQKEISKIQNEVENLHVPPFIEKIEGLLDRELPYKFEILSINKVRNCLVHRHGVVGEKDVKNEDSQTLKLKWTEAKFWTLKEGKRVDITYENRKDGMHVSNLQYDKVPKLKEFDLNKEIKLDLNEFNGVAYTCLEFASDLFQLMPQDDIL